MSKSTKPKVAETKTETPKVEETVKVGTLLALPENSEAEIIGMPKSEAIEKGLIKEVVPDNTEVDVPFTTIKEAMMELAEKAEPIKVIENKKGEVDIEKSPIEAAIVKFVDGNKERDFTLNDFLKIQLGETYNHDYNSKELMRTLAGLVNEGKLVIEGDNHLKLGTSYWHDGSPETQYRNLDTVELVVKK